MENRFEPKIIKCPFCELPSEDETFCGHCGRYNSEAPAVSPEKHLPPGIMRDPMDMRYRISRSWVYFLGKTTTFILLGLGVMLLLICILGTGIKGEGAGTMPYIGAGMVLFSGLMIFNRTRITVSENFLEVRRGPVPIPLADSFSLSRTQIKRIDLMESRGKYTTWGVKVFTIDNRILDVLDLENVEEGIAFYRFISWFFKEENPRTVIPSEDIERFIHSPQWGWSGIYTAGIIGSLFMNLPAILLVKRWRFDTGYWHLFLLFTAAIFSVFYFHHRKYLSFWDSKPIRDNEKPVGALGYILVSLAMAFLLTPIAMALYNLTLFFKGL